MKKVISLLICLVLIVGISVTACALNIDVIQPDTSTIIVGVTGEDVPVHGTLPHYNAGPNTIVIINPAEKLEGVPTNPITNKPVEAPTNNEPEKTETPTTNNDNETTPKEEVNLTALQSEIYALINEERINKNLKPLEYNFEMQDAVDIRAKEASTQFAHTRPDNTDFATVLGIEIEYEVAGENLLLIDKPIADAEVIVDTWMHSKGHMDNILAERYYETAIGVCEKDGVIYIAQLFIG